MIIKGVRQRDFQIGPGPMDNESRLYIDFSEVIQSASYNWFFADVPLTDPATGQDWTQSALLAFLSSRLTTQVKEEIVNSSPYSVDETTDSPYLYLCRDGLDHINLSRLIEALVSGLVTIFKLTDTQRKNLTKEKIIDYIKASL